MEKILLKDIAGWCGVDYQGKIIIEKISTDSREVDEKTLFLALVGERFDANDFVDEVLKKGAAAVICSRYDGVADNVIIVENTGKALLDIARGFRKRFEIPFVALTGSVGKTTSKGMIYSVVSSKLDALKTAGNLNNEIGVPKTLFRLERHHQAAVIEMGMNHFGEISRLSRTVLPDIAVITNVGTAHIENLGSREGILKAKCEILDGMKKGSPIVINGDNELLGKYENPDYRIIRFGLGENNHMRAENIEQTTEGSRFVAVYGDEKTEAFVPAVGIHNVYNALSAMCVGILLGFTLREAADGLEGFEPEGMRQKITSIRNMTFIEDCYNANLDSMCASLETLKTLKGKRSIAVLGDMLELGEFSAEAHRRVGEKAVQTECDIVLTYGEASRNISEAFSLSGRESRAFDNKTELKNYLKSILREGDTLLFKGSRGMKMEEIFTELYKEWEV